MERQVEQYELAPGSRDDAGRCATRAAPSCGAVRRPSDGGGLEGDRLFGVRERFCGADLERVEVFLDSAEGDEALRELESATKVGRWKKNSADLEHVDKRFWERIESILEFVENFLNMFASCPYSQKKARNVLAI